MAILYQHGIPTAGKHINIRDLHPEARERQLVLFKLCAAAGLRMWNYSAVRTYDHQKRLYVAYLNRGRRHPVVANPDRVNSRGRRGSAHMQQKAKGYRHGNLSNQVGYGYASDIGFTDRRRPSVEVQKQFHALVKKADLYPSVSTEWWHLVPTPNADLRVFGALGWNGQAVADIQEDLNRVLGADLTVDGWWGNQTSVTVDELQRRGQVVPTGYWTERENEVVRTLQAKTASNVSKSAGVDRATKQRMREIVRLAREQIND